MSSDPPEVRFKKNLLLLCDNVGMFLTEVRNDMTKQGKTYPPEKMSLQIMLGLGSRFLATTDPHQLILGFIEHTYSMWDWIRDNDLRFLYHFCNHPLGDIKSLGPIDSSILDMSFLFYDTESKLKTYFLPLHIKVFYEFFQRFVLCSVIYLGLLQNGTYSPTENSARVVSLLKLNHKTLVRLQEEWVR